MNRLCRASAAHGISHIHLLSLCGLAVGARRSPDWLCDAPSEDADQSTAFVAEFERVLSLTVVVLPAQRDRDAASSFAVEIAVEKSTFFGA